MRRFARQDREPRRPHSATRLPGDPRKGIAESRWLLPLACAALAMFAGGAAHAQIAVSTGDGKQLRPEEASQVRVPDDLSVLDLHGARPVVLASLQVATSLIGPPTTLAVSPDGRFAVVAQSQRLSDDGKTEPGDTLSLVDIAHPRAPKLLGSWRTGKGASGVSISGDGKRVLVASGECGCVRLFALGGGALTEAATLQLPEGSQPSDVLFLPGGHSAVVAAQRAGKLLRVTVGAKSLALEGEGIVTGGAPYGMVASPDGRTVYATDLGARAAPGAARPSAPAPAASAASAPPPAPAAAPAPRIGSLMAVDLASGTVTRSQVGTTPENVSRSADGRMLAVVVGNGSASQESAPGYHPFGLLKLFRVAGTDLTPVAEARTGGWCQGALFRRDGSILLQCAKEREIEVYALRGGALVRDDAATLHFETRPAAIAAPGSR